MARPATYDDAQLLLRLYELRREPVMRDARKWFVNEFKAATLEEWQKKAPPGSQMDAWFRQVTTYWEMACSMVTSGVLHPDLFIPNSLELLVVWTKIEGFVPDLRAMQKNPGRLKNLEQVAAQARAYLDAQGPETLASFLSRWKP